MSATRLEVLVREVAHPAKSRTHPFVGKPQAEARVLRQRRELPHALVHLASRAQAEPRLAVGGIEICHLMQNPSADQRAQGRFILIEVMEKLSREEHAVTK